jgi:hypothetical protein
MKMYATVYSTQREVYSYDVDLLPREWETMSDWSKWEWLEMRGDNCQIEDSTMLNVTEVEDVGA